MTYNLHQTLTGRDAYPRVLETAEDGSVQMILRFERLAEMILGFYVERSYDHIGAKPFLGLSRRGSELLRNVLPREFGPKTVDFIHWQVRNRIENAGKMGGDIEHESFHLPKKFAKLSYNDIVDTLLWYAEYASDEERELIMEFLLTNGRCEGGWNEFNEKNRRVQAILAQVANSHIVQQFPKE